MGILKSNVLNMNQKKWSNHLTVSELHDWIEDSLRQVDDINYVTKTVFVTPEIAEYLLSIRHMSEAEDDGVYGDGIEVVGNRKVSDANLEKIRAMVASDDWAVTHQGLRINQEGILDDGQHRLKFVARSGMTLPMKIDIGGRYKDFDKIDNGKNRNKKDIANTLGMQTNDSHISSSGNAAIALIRGHSGTGRVTNADFTRFVNENRDLMVKSVEIGLRLYNLTDHNISPRALCTSIILILKAGGDEYVLRQLIEDLKGMSRLGNDHSAVRLHSYGQRGVLKKESDRGGLARDTFKEVQNTAVNMVNIYNSYKTAEERIARGRSKGHVYPTVPHRPEYFSREKGLRELGLK